MVTVAGGLVEVSGELVWTEGKNKQSRRKFVVDAETARLLRAHRAAHFMSGCLPDLNGTTWIWS